jgi:hypothetical protein
MTSALGETPVEESNAASGANVPADINSRGSMASMIARPARRRTSRCALREWERRPDQSAACRSIIDINRFLFLNHDLTVMDRLIQESG